ncbi:hypothetical protein [Rhizobium sp. CAU 1783]
MASSNFLQRSALVIVPAASLVSCVGDGLAPPADVGSARPEVTSSRQLEARGDEIEILGRVGEPVAYAPEPVRRSGAAVAIDYLDTPNLAGLNSHPDAVQPSMVQTDAAYGDAAPATEAATAAAPLSATGVSEIPPEGVNMDAELGVSTENELGVGSAAPQQTGKHVAPQILVPQGAMAIAEGATSQPVVDGIGTDNPVPILPMPGQATDSAY